jgi:pSer/pThr/pTyr-binding forkhead associated (FHA) protein
MSEAMSDAIVCEPKKPSRLKGMKLRDEFVCPITFEVMNDPVVGSDGHTYERGAIEKWLRSNSKSPRNGEPLPNKTLVPNLNLKKLIQDLMYEGGSGLYCVDNADKSRLFDVYPEKIVVLKCLGPPESEWNGQSFQITPVGCVGGRKVVDPPNGREIVAFRDSTVSRKHFEVMCDPNTKKYALRDLGSAGGTFVRIPYNERRELHPGMMLLIGKHQFTVSSIDHARTGTGSGSGAAMHSPGSSSAQNRSMIDSIVDEAEHLIQHLSNSVSAQKLARSDKEAGPGGAGQPGGGELDERLKQLSTKMTRLRMISHPGRGGALPPTSEEDEASDGKDARSPARKRQNVNSSRVEDEGGLGMSLMEDDCDTNMGPAEAKAMGMSQTMSANAAKGAEGKGEDSGDDDEEASVPAAVGRNSGGRGARDFSQQRCTITCFAPDGSPLQGQGFVVDVEGASIGRKVGSQIPLYVVQDVLRPEGEDCAPVDPTLVTPSKIVNLDTAVSSEHARIEMDRSTGKFYILDGTVKKPSTNGTWVRLSGPNQESPYSTLLPNTELLIGTVRFVVSESMTVLEQAVLASAGNSSAGAAHRLVQSSMKPPRDCAEDSCK